MEEYPGWEARGGTVVVTPRTDGKAVDKKFKAPDGKTLRSWKACVEWMTSHPPAAAGAAAEAPAAAAAVPAAGTVAPTLAKKRDAEAAPAAEAVAGNKGAKKAKKVTSDGPVAATALVPIDPATVDAAMADAEPAVEATAPAKGKSKKVRPMAAAHALVTAPKRAKGLAVPHTVATAADGGGDDDTKDDGDGDDGEGRGDAAAAAPTRHTHSGRAAMATYVEPGGAPRGCVADSVVVIADITCGTEAEALAQTGDETCGDGTGLSRRRLADFVVIGPTGKAAPLASLSYADGPLCLSGVVYPTVGGPDVDKSRGRRVRSLGAVITWRVGGYPQTGGAPTMNVTTAGGDYELLRPAGMYKKTHGVTLEKAFLARAVATAITVCRPGGASGMTPATVAEASAAAASAASKAKGPSSAKAKAGEAPPPTAAWVGPDATLLHFVMENARPLQRTAPQLRASILAAARFIIQELDGLDAAAPARGGRKGKSAAVAPYSASRLYRDLLESVASGAGTTTAMAEAAAARPPGGVVIRDGENAPGAANPPSAESESDAALAHRLQQQEHDAASTAALRAVGGGGRGGRGGAAAAAAAAGYVRVAAAEIAEDYPRGVTMYTKEEEETDELQLMMDADAPAGEVDPADLPRHGLVDWAVYDADGALASLELLPMGAGVEPDTELYGSGVLTEEGDAWGGVDGGEGSGAVDPSIAAAPGGGGPRMFLSQLREWVIEAGPSGSSIMVRTDQSWYRLGAPAAAYAPWFRVVTSASRAAVAALVAVDNAKRKSAVTLMDAAKAARADQPDAAVHVTVARAKRSLVTHGAILLALSAAWPNKDVAKCALRAAVRARMVERRHVIITEARRRVKGSPSNANPTRDMAARRKLRPMRATATVAINSLWAEFFARAEAQQTVQAAKAAAATGAKDAKVAAGAEGEGAEDEAVVAGTTQAPPAAAAPSVPRKPPARATKAKAAAADDDDDDGTDDDDDDDGGVTDSDGGDDSDGGGAAAAPRHRRTAAAVPKPPKAKPAVAPKRVGAARVSQGAWVGPSMGSRHDGSLMYRAATFNGRTITIGDTVVLPPCDDPEPEDGGGDDDDATVADPPAPRYALVQSLYQVRGGAPGAPGMAARVRLWARGAATVLGDVASPRELFLTTEGDAYFLSSLSGVAIVTRRDRDWATGADAATRKRAADDADDAEAAAAAAAGGPLRFYYRSLWLPTQGAFTTAPPVAAWGIGDPECPTEVEARAALGRSSPVVVAGALTLGGVTYHPGDGVYLAPGAMGSDDITIDDAVPLPDYVTSSKGGHKGSNERAAAFGVATLLGWAAGGTKLKVRRFYRPEEAASTRSASRTRALQSKLWELAAPAGVAASRTIDIPTDKLRGRCAIVAAGVAVAGAYGHEGYTPGAADTFVVTSTWDSDRGVRGAPPTPAELDTIAGRGAAAAGEGGAAVAVAKAKGGSTKAAKGITPSEAVTADAAITAASRLAAATTGWLAGITGHGGAAGGGLSSALSSASPRPEDGITPLATMDIFAGCGGLSEGLSTSGVVTAKWAIEYEKPAAEAFGLNHPGALVLNHNCNVILRAAMAKAGLTECTKGGDGSCVADGYFVADAEATKEASELAASDPALVQRLPLPGEVEFINGGPPCQGYSGMNRFNTRVWSLVQNEMVLAFLSYADFYRPRYFLLENVRNFVAFNKGLIFRLTLRSLLEMGYQVRFGVLNAANYGVAQSRRRTFIWGVAPGEVLPRWPQPLHAFQSPQLAVPIGNGETFCAVPRTPGAPLRAMSVRDVIGDLPPIVSGAAAQGLSYDGHPVSEFQSRIRGGATSLQDHISKQLNALNLKRCQHIPKNVPGADWRSLREYVAEHPSEDLFKKSTVDGKRDETLVPWCLGTSEAAKRHNDWRGLFGRLDWDGHFPTATTDPQPMGKVGQVFHPEQDRIVSVRECARAQGFPDTFMFSGNIHARHRQVGNAVPPPLAFALGRQLKKALLLKAAGAGGEPWAAL